MSDIDEYLDSNPQPTARRLTFTPSTILFVLGTIVLLAVVSLYVHSLSRDNEAVVIETKDASYLVSNSILIDISGAVQQPGVYELPPGSRTQEVIIKAGGLHEMAHTEWVQKSLNLASTLQDGQKIYVPFASEDIQVTQTVSSTTQGNRLNINTATQQQLEDLPNIGPVGAQKILKYRQEHGKYSSIDEIKQVPGIGEGLYSGLKDLITVD